MEFKIGDQAIHGLKMPRNTSEKYHVYEMPVTIVGESKTPGRIIVRLNKNPSIHKSVPIDSLRKINAE